MKVADFDYELPPESIAQRPPARREDARLLAHDLDANATRDLTVRALPELLDPGDLLVVNDTRVLPARLFGRRASGGLVEFLLLRPCSDEGSGDWYALVNPARKLRPGEDVRLEGGEDEPRSGALRLIARATQTDGEPSPEWRVRWMATDAAGEVTGPGSAAELARALQRFGRMPLPPYIERARGGADPLAELDRERYQTVFAREPGAVAAPTAGLHLTPELFAELDRRGVHRAHVTLHVGIGTFRPVRALDTEDHAMHSERFEIKAAAAEAVRACRARGGRVVAVGTTSVRALEASAGADGVPVPGTGATDLFLTPGSEFRVVDALLTNFHMPRSTLLMLVSAFAGRERILELYRGALERGYRFLSYGDAMLLHGRERRVR